MQSDERTPQPVESDTASIKPWQRISEVFHPFHPDEDHEAAFAHALKMAVVAGARLSLMSLQPAEEAHGSPMANEPWDTLLRWGRLSEKPQEQPDLKVRHLQVASQNPVRACVNYLKDNPTDLIVLASHLQQGRMTWLGRSTAETLAAKTGQMTLFVPEGIKGFVGWNDGAVSLQNIVVAVAREPSPEPAIEAARRVMLSMPGRQGTVTLIHVGKPEGVPQLQLPEIPGWSWKLVCREGDVVESILKAAAEVRADLIVMTTAGTHGFLDVLRGTVTEHVLREARCPLLAMPVGSFLG